MTPKYTTEQFENAKSRELLELECEYCHNNFKLIKKIILDAINKRDCKAKYCSHKCSSQAHKKQLKVNCLNCNAEIYRTPYRIRKSNNRSFCSKICSIRYFGKLHTKPRPPKIIKLKREPIKCLNCSNLTFNTKYCSGTCRNKVNNQNIKGSKSKAETILVTELKSNFPQWTIIENNRKILPDGLELDVYIPEIKLAIEWNGIFHYEPIRGREFLNKVVNKDVRKIQLCKDIGIELIVICDRTSHIRFIKETVSTLIQNLKKMAGVTDTASVLTE